MHQEDRYERRQAYRRFKDISVSERILNTVFLLTIGLGYLAALANMYYTIKGLMAKPDFLLKMSSSVIMVETTKPVLGTAINGIMKSNLKYISDKDVILHWIHHGADEPEYIEKIAPILNRDCVICHTPSVNPSLPDLTHYATVSEIAHAGGATIPTLVRVSHIHLFGIALFYFFIGKIFCFVISCLRKRVAVVIPFGCNAIGCCVMVYHQGDSSFAYVVIFSGALMGLSMGLQILLSIYQMWFFSNKNS